MPSAPWPDDSTAGVASAITPSAAAGAGRAQPDRHAAAAEQRLGQRDAAHDGDADQRADHAERQQRDVVHRLDLRRHLHVQVERRAAERLQHGIGDDRGHRDRREGGQRVGADDQLEGVERAGQRGVEGAADRRRRRRSRPARACRCGAGGSCGRSARRWRRRSGCSRPPARPRRRRRSTSWSAHQPAGRRSATCARRTARWPRSRRPSGAARCRDRRVADRPRMSPPATGTAMIEASGGTRRGAGRRRRAGRGSDGEGREHAHAEEHDPAAARWRARARTSRISLPRTRALRRSGGTTSFGDIRQGEDGRRGPDRIGLHDRSKDAG